MMVLPSPFQIYAYVNIVLIKLVNLKDKNDDRIYHIYF